MAKPRVEKLFRKGRWACKTEFKKKILPPLERCSTCGARIVKDRCAGTCRVRKRSKFDQKQDKRVLTDEQVDEIRMSRESQKALAKKYGVSVTTIVKSRARR